MMRVGPRVAIFVWTLCLPCLPVAWVSTARGEGACGNGIVNHNEECDPGGALHCNGDPRLPTCRTGADCASGVNCYFALSCCKFNCQYVGQGATCYDGNDCTGPDRCNNVGLCTGNPQSGNPCDDGNTCTSNDTCVQGTCTGTLPAECDDHNPCTDDFCDPVSGCGHTYNTAPCDDGQLCTGNDTCRDGVCTGSSEHAPNCDDGNPCTDDCCDPAANDGAGACVTTNNTAPCDDGLFCTGPDRCSNGQCVSGPPFDCNDGNHCTVDFCDEQARACRNVGDSSKAGQSCDDHNRCTSGDICDASGGCSGTPVHCDDGDDVCTADSCNAATGCVFTVVAESPQCMSCRDGVDNDGDGNTDLQDCKCNLLCETFEFAVVAQRNSTRRTAYFGKDAQAKRGLDPAQGSWSHAAPYPLGPSAANACSQGKLELVERAIIDGAAVASTRAAFGDGDQMFLGFFAGFVPPGQLTTTGIPPFVGPPALCSTTLAPCSEDAHCLPTEKCRPQRSLADPDNGHVDLTGTHLHYIDCEVAKASLHPDFETLFARAPTMDLGSLHFEGGDPAIDVSGPGQHVVHLDSLRVKTGAVLPVVGSASTDAVLFQIERSFNIGVQARIELRGGLTPDRVLWLVDRRGRLYVGNQDTVPPDDTVATLPGTLLAPGKNIVIGKKARIAGALLGREVQLNEKAVVSHRPYVAAVP